MTEKSTRCVQNGRFSSGYSCSTDHFTPCAVSFSDLLCILVFYIWIRKVFLFALLAIFGKKFFEIFFENFRLIKSDKGLLKYRVSHCGVFTRKDRWRKRVFTVKYIVMVVTIHSHNTNFEYISTHVYILLCKVVWTETLFCAFVRRQIYYYMRPAAGYGFSDVTRRAS